MEQASSFSVDDIRVCEDKATFSNCKDVKTTHIHFDWYVNFDKSILEGTVTLSMTAVNDIQTVTLDAWGLDIHKVTCKHDDHSHDLEFKVGDETEIGSKLDITLNENQKAGSSFKLVFEYATQPGSKSLSWCTPEQTIEGKFPYLYSQSEPIYARCMFPCQDTPSIKAPYTATVRSHLKVLMSADIVEERKAEEGEDTITEFSMSMPIPSYLVSIAVGKLSFRKIGERCGVYCEESFVDKVAAEFEDMEQFLKVGEEILFEYPLKNYFVVILPPSFPYGGMENPVTTFGTPTIIVGDKSAVNVVCHEITHSWTGNYLTNSNWEDFWLNEGFTRYIEAKMVHRIYGDNAHKLHLKDGLSSLKGVLQKTGSKGDGCVLVPKIEDKQNPDDVIGITQYEKGHYFLYFLEKLISEENMLAFLRQYLKKREGGNINTKEFAQDFIGFVKTTFDETKANELLAQIDWKTWLYDGELPPVLHPCQFDELDQSEAALDSFIEGKTPESLDYLKGNTGLLIAFTQRIMLEESKLDAEKLERIDDALGISQMKNCEILVGWYHAALTLGYTKIHEQIYKFLGEVGRMKFVLPLYRALITTNKEKAEELFKKNESFYHQICKLLLQRMLK